MTIKHFFLICVLAALRTGALAQCSPLVFNPGNPAHTNISTIMPLNIVTDFCANRSSGLGIPPPNVCADTVMISCLPGGGYFPISDQAELSLESSYVVYPNPATEKRFDLSNRGGDIIYYEFLGVNGSLLEKGQLKGYATRSFNFARLSAGIYYLKIRQDKNVKVEKVVLQ